MSAEKAPREFELAVSLLGLHVTDVVGSSMVTMASLSYFAMDLEHKLFWSNPANMLQYRALKALEDRAIVEIGEMLNNEHKMIPDGISIRRKELLRNHRDVLSHPVKITWHRSGLQAFYDSHKEWTDVRAAIVWDMWHSLNEAFTDLGGQVGDYSIPVGGAHVTMLHGILRHAMKPEQLAALPSEDVLAGHLQKFRKDFLAFLSTRPEG
jgi:hypothetical protein